MHGYIKLYELFFIQREKIHNFKLVNYYSSYKSFWKKFILPIIAKIFSTINILYLLIKIMIVIIGTVSTN